MKDGHEADYDARHQQVWPEVKADMAAAGVARMGIWRQGTDVYMAPACAGAGAGAGAAGYGDGCGAAAAADSRRNTGTC